MKYISILISILLLASAPAGADDVPVNTGAPFGVGDSAGNIRLNSDGYAAIRWVARRDGTLSRLWVKTRTVTHGGAADASYWAGTTGTWRVETFLTTAEGKPDPQHRLAQEQFVPAERMRADSTPMGNSTGEAIGLKLDLKVKAGEEFITVFQNVDSAPATNYASLNFLYSASGLHGAQSRNQRDPAARDAMYGLDPRELVGGMYKQTWHLPGNNYGPFVKFLPTYVQQYSDGACAGQPYYSAHSLKAGTKVRQHYVIDRARTVVTIGAFLTAADSFAASISHNGKPKGTAMLSGKADQFVSANLQTPIEVAAGDTLDIDATINVAGALKSLYADSVFDRLMGLGKGCPWSYAADPKRTVPLYPISR